MKARRLRRNIAKTRRTVRDVAVLNEGPWRWAVGVQTAIAIGVPVGLFTFTGHQSYGLIASLGGFTVMYAVSYPLGERLRALPFVGIGLIIASVLGVLCAMNEWMTVACLIVVTVVTSILTFGTGLGPPGPVLFVLVAAVSAQLAAPVRSAGASLAWYIIPLLVAAGAALAYAAVVILSALPFLRNGALAAGNPPLSFRIRLNSEMKMVSIRVIISVAIAILISKQLGIHRSYWVFVATAAILQAGQNRRLTTVRAIQRVLGTLLGVGLFQLIHSFHPAGFWVVLLIMLLQFATQVVIARNYVLGLFFITPLALVNSTIGQASTLITVRERIIDTLLGAGIALVVFWLEEWWMKAKTRAISFKKAGSPVPGE